jgi:uncharacterized protein
MAFGSRTRSDEHAIVIRELDAGEERWVSIGSDPAGRLLIVVYTLMPHRIRIISARRATGRERIQYEEKQ